MTFIEWIDANLPRIKERMKTQKKALRQRPSGISACTYRVDGDPNNTAPENCCFIGYCIAPEHYSPLMDAPGVDTFVDIVAIRYPEAFGGLVIGNGSTEADLLHGLQGIHDNYPPTQWPSKFAEWLDAYQTYKQSLLAP